MRLLGLLFVLFVAPPPAAAEQVKTVVLFMPEDTTVPATAEFTRSFRAAMRDVSREPVLVNIEYLDMSWFESAGYKRALRDFYLVKYRERRPDVIVVSADATPLLLELQQELWPGVPLLCILNDDFLVEALPKRPHLYGYWADFDVTATARLAVRLLPGMKRAALILGSSPREKEAWPVVSGEVHAGAPELEIIPLRDISLEELRRRVRTLPPDTVVFLIGFMRDVTGQSLITRDVLRLLYADGAPPLFSVHQTMMGEGIVGGMLLDYVKLGQEVARRTRWVLDGESPASALPANLNSNRPVFDARELKRWNIPDSRLPPGGVVRFHEPGLWERYRWQVTALLAAGLLQAGLILVLLVERRRRMGAQRLNLAVLDSLPGAVAILDRHGTVLRSSPASSDPLGREGAPTGSLLPGRRFLDAFREMSSGEGAETRSVESLLAEVLSARAHEGGVEFRGLVPGTWFELRARRLERSEGGAAVSVVDVTPRRSAEREARQARDERAHLERVAAVGELGVSIAHELNQPLAAIRTNAETAQRLLQRTPMDVALLREVLQDIVSDDQRAGEVIRHMRALLKKGGGHTGLHDLNTLAREVLRLVGNDAQLRGVSLTPQLSEGSLPVRGDDVQLQQVVLNLTLNALEAVGPRPPDQRRVWIRTRRLDERVELVVEDSGVGLSDEVLAHLFQPFFTTRSEGLGMGLSISRSILEVHQGRLQAERRAGGGALFRCILPAA